MTLEETRHIWVTSDTHFNHSKIIEYCNRPFSSVGEMNETLINNWNKVVSKDDTVYHLGDFALGEQSTIPGILARLKGNIKFIMGNHDNFNFMNDLAHYHVLQSLSYEEVLKVGKHVVIMNHYPFSSLPTSKVIQLFGHVHSTPDKPWLHFNNQYDVGVDNNNYTPVNLYELITKLCN